MASAAVPSAAARARGRAGRAFGKEPLVVSNSILDRRGAHGPIGHMEHGCDADHPVRYARLSSAAVASGRDDDPVGASDSRVVLAGSGCASDRSLDALFCPLPWAVAPPLHRRLGRRIFAHRAVRAAASRPYRALSESPKLGSCTTHQIAQGDPHWFRGASLAYATYAAYQLQAIIQSRSDSAFSAELWEFLLFAPIVVLGSFGVAWSVVTLTHPDDPSSPRPLRRPQHRREVQDSRLQTPAEGFSGSTVGFLNAFDRAAHSPLRTS